MLGPLPAVLMHLVSVLFLMKKSLELGVTLQEFLQKSLGFSLLGLAHIAAASKSINFALGVEKTCAGSNQLLLTVCLVSLPSAPKYKDFCIISKLLCKTLFGLGFTQEVCDFLSKPVLSFHFVIKPQTRQVLCGFGFHCKHFTLL